MSGLCLGVVGLGLGRRFVAAAADNPAVDRLVTCDPDQARREEIAGKFPAVAAAYADLEEMLAREKPAAVCLVTPDHRHRPHAEACFAAGAHLLLTKPLACNLDDARAIVRAAAAADRRLMVAHERRFRQRFQGIKAILDSGELGELIHLRIDAIQDKRNQFRRAPWYASVAAGRTAIVGTGIHEVDLLRFLVGQPVVSVCACGSRRGPLEFPADKTTAALFRFADGTIGQVTVTYESRVPGGRPPPGHFLLLASRGVIADNRLAREGAADWEDLPGDQYPLAAGVRGCVSTFLAAVAAGREVPVTGADAFASLAACVAADRAAASGQTVVPEEL